MDSKILHRIINSPILDKFFLVAAISGLLTLTTFLFLQIKTLENAAEEISHSLTMDKEINNLFSQFDLMESSEFRSVILKDTTFEQSYIDHKLEGDKSLKLLYDLVGDLPGYKTKLDSVTKLKDSLHATLSALHGKVNPFGVDSTALVYVKKGSDLLKNLQKIKADILWENQELLEDRLEAYRRHTFLTPLITIILALFSVIIFTIAFLRLRRQKNKIQTSEMLLQNIVQSTDNIMNYYQPIYDSNGEVVDFRVVFANICNWDYLKLKPKDLIGKPISEVFPFVLKNNELDKMIDCFTEDKTIDFERQITVDGEMQWFHSFVRGMDGGILEVVRNNTEEYNAKKDLLKLNQELEVQNFIMTEAKKVAKIGSYTWYLDKDVAEFSDNYYIILGCEPGEFVPAWDTYRNFVHPEDLIIYDEYIAMGKTMNPPKAITYRIISKQGITKYIKTIDHKIKKGGKTVMIGVVQDVSDQIQVENKLKLKNQELKRGNVELESFNRVVSHDLQEPLRKIQMFISRINDDEKNALSERSAGYFDRIDKVAARMQSLIRNLLTYSRIGNEQADTDKVDLSVLMDKVTEEYSERIASVGANVIWGELPKVSGVSFQLEQLFGNLTSNSLKYHNPEVPLQIEIKSEIVSKKQLPKKLLKNSKQYHKITFSDNGIGFDDENSKKIFDVFQRLHAKTQYSGTGIGLAICKKIVENHQGFIFASGETGKGSIFSIYLPI
ncbi:ATP-binding protein [Allomuricauda sp. F6463D]|uniref:ATP-binding protein n=1 Tax=Allomuricauda sp. F6463D TaxID=2926409 RepID=UPI001FF59102|nr:ATP-binding protein [Muricauda sp. F6463D]MCK0159178.1 ATP-binding protein [Muricauda sp. F6463D]